MHRPSPRRFVKTPQCQSCRRPTRQHKVRHHFAPEIGAPSWRPSVGQTPFGFAFTDARDRRRRRPEVLIVSEAFGGAPGASAATSYVFNDDDELEPITRSAPTTQTAACWIAITPNGRFAYATNTGSGTVTGYHVRRGGALVRLDGGVTGTTGGAPIDATVSPDGDTLYVLDDSRDTIVAFRVRKDGTLVLLGERTGLPPPRSGWRSANASARRRATDGPEMKGGAGRDDGDSLVGRGGRAEKS